MPSNPLVRPQREAVHRQCINAIGDGLQNGTYRVPGWYPDVHRVQDCIRLPCGELLPEMVAHVDWNSAEASRNAMEQRLDRLGRKYGASSGKAMGAVRGRLQEDSWRTSDRSR